MFEVVASDRYIEIYHSW